jgi:hypothetical protein
MSPECPGAHSVSDYVPVYIYHSELHHVLFLVAQSGENGKFQKQAIPAWP